MSPSNAELLRSVQQDARIGRVTLTKHAREEMAEASALAPDVERAIRTATTIIQQPDGCLRLEGGSDTDGDSLIVVVKQIQSGLLVVTVFA